MLLFSSMEACSPGGVVSLCAAYYTGCASCLRSPVGQQDRPKMLASLLDGAAPRVEGATPRDFLTNGWAVAIGLLYGHPVPHPFPWVGLPDPPR